MNSRNSTLATRYYYRQALHPDGRPMAAKGSNLESNIPHTVAELSSACTFAFQFYTQPKVVL